MQKNEMLSIAIIEKAKRLNKEIEKCKYDFKYGLLPKLESMICEPLTKALIEECKNLVNEFLERNNLDISVNVTIKDQCLVMMGNGLMDEIVWRYIQEGGDDKA